MFKNAGEEAEIAKKLSAFCITLTGIENEMTGSYVQTKEVPIVEKMKICMLCTQFWIIVKNHLYVEENFNSIS